MTLIDLDRMMIRKKGSSYEFHTHHFRWYVKRSTIYVGIDELLIRLDDQDSFERVESMLNTQLYAIFQAEFDEIRRVFAQ